MGLASVLRQCLSLLSLGISDAEVGYMGLASVLL